MKEHLMVRGYSGYKAQEKPRSFIFQGKEYIIDNIEKTWIEEDFSTRERKIFFKVKAQDDQAFEISYNPTKDFWLLEKP